MGEGENETKADAHAMQLKLPSKMNSRTGSEGPKRNVGLECIAVILKKSADVQEARTQGRGLIISSCDAAANARLQPCFGIASDRNYSHSHHDVSKKTAARRRRIELKQCQLLQAFQIPCT